MPDGSGDAREDVVRDVNRALVRADDREDLERAVVDIVTGADRYRFAWIGRYDREAGTVEPAAHAGSEAGYLADLTLSDDPEEPSGRGPAGEALREGTVVVVDDVAEDASFEPWRAVALERGYRSVAAVPLVAGTTVHGLLGVYGERKGAFGEAERQELAEIGANVGHAVAAREHEHDLERYRMLVETVGDPMYVLDAEGHVEMANAAMAAMLDRPTGNLVGTHVSSFMPSADVERGTELLLDLVEDPERRWASFEMDVVPDDGERVHSENRVAALTDEAGNLAGSVGVVRDITDRVREREHLRELTDRIERLHGVATELQTATDAERVYDLAVEAGEEILGFDWCVVALAEEGWFELAVVSDGAPVDAGERLIRLDEGLAGQAYQTGESMLTGDGHEDDRSRPVHDSFVSSIVVPLGDIGVFQANAGRQDHFDGRDVELAELLGAHVFEALRRIDHETELRAREQELERQNDRLEQFASAVSHDLRNPLNLAAGRLELAMEAADPAVQRELGQVDWALDRMDRLIEDVLTLARQGQAPEDTAPVALRTVAGEAWATTVGRDGELVLTGDPGRIVADEDRLLRLLENLFRNAAEHADTDPRVSIGPTEGGFYVADDGPGIPPGDRDRVFESGYTTREDGTGFGLAIVREIAAAHGWSVGVGESEAGGALFQFAGVEVVDEPD